MNKREELCLDAVVSVNELISMARTAHAYYAITILDGVIASLKGADLVLKSVMDKRAELGLDD